MNDGSKEKKQKPSQTKHERDDMDLMEEEQPYNGWRCPAEGETENERSEETQTVPFNMEMLYQPATPLNHIPRQTQPIDLNNPLLETTLIPYSQTQPTDKRIHFLTMALTEKPLIRSTEGP